jgi:hypothetical protein
MDSSFHHFQFAFREVAPTAGETLHFLHSDALEKDHPARLFVSEMLEELTTAEGISGGYLLKRRDSLSLSEGKMVVGEQELNVGRQIAGYLRESEWIALFLCTAGPLFAAKTNELNRNGDMMEAFLLDAIGSLTVEKAMDQIQQQLSEEVHQQGMQTSNRYSPGYCNWDLQEQKKLFHLIGDNPVGITLTPSCLMVPAKSVSGIIGIGTHLRRYAYGCAICNNSNCIYRRIIHDSDQ